MFARAEVSLIDLLLTLIAIFCQSVALCHCPTWRAILISPADRMHRPDPSRLIANQLTIW